MSAISAKSKNHWTLPSTLCIHNTPGEERLRERTRVSKASIVDQIQILSFSRCSFEFPIYQFSEKKNDCLSGFFALYFFSPLRNLSLLDFELELVLLKLKFSSHSFMTSVLLILLLVRFQSVLVPMFLRFWHSFEWEFKVTRFLVILDPHVDT